MRTALENMMLAHGVHTKTATIVLVPASKMYVIGIMHVIKRSAFQQLHVTQRADLRYRCNVCRLAERCALTP